MKLDDLLKTKAGQDPRNRKALQECAESVGAASITRGPLSAVAGPGPGQRKPVSGKALDTQPSRNAKSKVRVVVLIEITAFGRREIDDDNISSGTAKPLRDAIAKSLGVDDGDKRLRWRYRRVLTEGSSGTLVRIERLQ